MIRSSRVPPGFIIGINHFFRINYKFNQRGTFGILLCFLKRCSHFCFVENTDALSTIALCQLYKIRCIFRDILLRWYAVKGHRNEGWSYCSVCRRKLLLLAYHTQIFVIEYAKDQRKLFQNGCGKFPNIHLHAAIA